MCTEISFNVCTGRLPSRLKSFCTAATFPKIFSIVDGTDDVELSAIQGSASLCGAVSVFMEAIPS
jgi:hypothetical protein